MGYERLQRDAVLSLFLLSPDFVVIVGAKLCVFAFVCVCVFLFAVEKWEQKAERG